MIEAWVDQGLIEWWGYRADMPQVYAPVHIVCLPSYTARACRGP